jgi:FAD/FMN-containing dehydrogenase
VPAFTSYPCRHQHGHAGCRFAGGCGATAHDLRDELGDTTQAFELIADRALQFVLRHIPDTRNPFAESYPWMVLVSSTAPTADLERTLEQAFEDELLLDAVLPKNETEADALWNIRHGVSEAQKSEGASMKHDVSVPVESAGRFIDAADEVLLRVCPGARIVAFGHVGDGNIHYNVSQPENVSADTFLAQREAVADAIYGVVAELGGSFSAEHGIGQERRKYLQQYRSATELATMRAIKAALDPQGIMNPGKVL